MHTPDTYPDNQNNSRRNKLHPDAAFAKTLAEHNASGKVADRVPHLKLAALILLGLIAFSAIQAVSIGSVASTVDSQNAWSFLSFVDVLSWLIGAVCAGVLLGTRNPQTAKRVLLVIGLAFGYFALRDVLAGFNPIGLIIDGFILWQVYVLYESTDALTV